MRPTWFIALAAGCCVLACSSRSEGVTEQAQASASERCSVGGVYSCVRWDCNGFRRCMEDGKLSSCTCYAADGGELDAGAATATPTRQPDSGASPKPASKPRDAGAPSKQRAADAGRTQLAEPPKQPPDAAMPSGPERCDNDERCVAAAPAAWRGPVAFQLATAAVSCSGMFDSRAFEAGDQPESEPAACSACSCQGSCSTFVDFATSDGPQCAGASCTTSVNASCVEISPQCLGSATTASLKTALPGASGCKPSEQKPTRSAASWKLRVTACESSTAARGGCAGEELCLPKDPGPGFEAPYCVWRDGEHGCEGSVFTRRRLYYRSLRDTRDCSPCTCAASGCTYTWRVFNQDDATCASPLLQLSAVEQCAQINPQQGKLRVGAEIKGDAACAAAGGESIGAVVADQAITMCCDG